MDWTSEIKAAQTRVAGHVRETPVMQIQGFGLGYPIEMKLEQMQHTGSFKARGAFNTLLSCPVPEAGLVAASGGNHGAAVAYAGAQLGSYRPDLCARDGGASEDRLDRAAGR